MQPAIIGNAGIGRENCRFYGRPITVKAAAIQGNVLDIFQIEINYIRGGRVQEAIEWLLQPEFEFSDDTDDFVNSCPVQQISRSIYEQTNVFVKFDIRR